MNNTYLWINLFAMIVMAAMMTPALGLMNGRDKLRNIIIWLMIAGGLALVYQVFGPFGQGQRGIIAKTNVETPAKPHQQAEPEPSSDLPQPERPKLGDEKEI